MWESRGKIMIKCPYCNSDMKFSSTGNLYCTNLCWTKEPYKFERLQEQIMFEAEMESRHSDWGER